MSPRAILSRDVSVMFNGGGDPRRGYEVKAKAGTRLELIENASGTEGDKWAIPPASCDAGSAGKAGTWSIFGHDSKHYYVWAPVDAVEVIE
jgi:hypothetical protein